MAEEPKTAPEPNEEHDDSAEDKRIPYARFEEVNSRAKKAEQDREELLARLAELEDRDKTEVERERSARQRAEQQLASLSDQVTSLEKGAWVRSAAAEFNFHDPEDAVSHLRDRLGSLEDAREAKRLVRTLAQSKKHLVKEDKPAERPRIGQMFAGDQVPQQGNGQPQKLTPQQAAAERELRFAEGLRDQLGQFRDGWHNAGGVI